VVVVVVVMLTKPFNKCNHQASGPDEAVR
jgi:hypothetical protein